MHDILDNKSIKKIIINQYESLGDILFSVPIAEYYRSLGYEIIWPIKDKFLEIKRNFPNINFISKENIKINYDYDHPYIFDKDSFVIPLRFSNTIIGGNNSKTCMLDKYKLIGIDLKIWKTLKWKRDIDKENDLYYNFLNLKDDDEFILINENFSYENKIIINEKNNIKKVYLRVLDDFNILDWYKVIQKSKIIHTVGTSLCFLIEVIDTPDLIDYFLYPRKPFESDCSNYDYLFNKVTKKIL